MKTLLIPVIILLMVLTVVTLGRGIAAFLQSTREDMERPDSAGPSEMQLKQNKLMMRRIIYQATAVLVVALLMFAAKD